MRLLFASAHAAILVFSGFAVAGPVRNCDDYAVDLATIVKNLSDGRSISSLEPIYLDSVNGNEIDAYLSNQTIEMAKNIYLDGNEVTNAILIASLLAKNCAKAGGLLP